MATKAPSTQTYYSYTDQNSAYQQIDAAFKATFGRGATDAEKKRYYNQLHATETANATIVTSGTTKTTSISKSFDKDTFTKEFLSQIAAYGLKKKPTQEFLGTAGQFQRELLNYANDKMGLEKSTKEINSYVIKILKGLDINEAYKAIKNDAIHMYHNFASRLKEDNPANLAEGVSVRDLANNYIQLMGSTLELDPTNIKLTDPTIQNLISADKLPNINEAKRVFRNDKRWSNTTVAIDESKQVGYSLLRAFGFGV
jgi:hypothetical protein